MPKNGPIIIVNESIQSQVLICKALEEIKIKNRVELCCSAEEALGFLENTTDKPFLIITKTSLPGMSGLEFQSKITETDHLRSKSIPLIFFSDIETPETVAKAYRMNAQGYFITPRDFIHLKLALFCITDYWLRVIHPSSVDYKISDLIE